MILIDLACEPTLEMQHSLYSVVGEPTTGHRQGPRKAHIS